MPAPEEFKTRVLLRWALDETVLRIPPKLQRPAAWKWDDADAQLVAQSDDGEFRFHVGMTSGRVKIRHAVLSVTDYDGRAKWEADIPAEVYAEAALET